MKQNIDSNFHNQPTVREHLLNSPQRPETRLKYVLQVILYVYDQGLERPLAIERVANTHGITKNTVMDKITRGLGLPLEDFDNLINNEKWSELCNRIEGVWGNGGDVRAFFNRLLEKPPGDRTFSKKKVLDSYLKSLTRENLEKFRNQLLIRIESENRIQ